LAETRIEDCTVIGGGIVGLALARALLRRRPGLRLSVLEKADRVAAHQTGHNSGVVHTGVYYRPGSLKARLCVAGAREMIAYCRERGLPLAVPGKVIVAAQEAERDGLEAIHRRGEQNGVEGLRQMDAGELREREPAVRGVAALLVPTAAIVDYAAVARSYAAEIEAAGGTVRLNCAAGGFGQDGAAVVVETSRGAVKAKQVVNCAGLYADRIAILAGSRAARHEFAVFPFRGEYYELQAAAAARVRGLIYPVPDPRFPFLGVHFTPRVHGGVEAGPSAVLAWRREGYRRTDWDAREMATMLGYAGFWAMAARYWRKGLGEQWRSWNRAAYLRALRGLMPDLSDADLAPGGAGVRAQVVLRNGKLLDDFHVLREGPFLHVINVPSPAATASLRIAEYLADQATGTARGSYRQDGSAASGSPVTA
jgi:L-2-hydroxyglutarate oxidase LhgO